MKAAALERFGGPDVIRTRSIPVPEVGPDEVLIRVDLAGVGSWDPSEREGELASYTEREAAFPYVLGSDGAGTVVAVGSRVRRFRVGDAVYAYGFLNPKGGFYAEYVAVKADNVAPFPKGLTPEQAGALAVDGLTALEGVDDALKVREGTTLLVFGASGGVGHLAVQLAKRLGARVLAVASGKDGVALARRTGADAAVDGHGEDVKRAVQEFAPEGLDAVLVFAHGRGLDDALAAVRDGGRVAWPNGVEPAPKPRAGLKATAYDGLPSPEAYARLNRLIESGPFHVEVQQVYRLEDAARAHQAVSQHHLGKVALRIH
ncbi:MAG: NADP-dependent oxidoreductase [Myxococcaceae bacterium]|nr:NADP-dependent oxidoreductase [Myxococcaceae bacterium]MCI0669851.1 NADP-dependent oxidoreductase [Myxococcaceae bacterium]